MDKDEQRHAVCLEIFSDLNEHVSAREGVAVFNEATRFLESKGMHPQAASAYAHGFDMWRRQTTKARAVDFTLEGLKRYAA